MNHFIAQNIWLVTALTILIIAYIIFESKQTKNKTFLISPQDSIRLANKEKAVYFDLRDQTKYNESHIINAINIDISNNNAVLKLLKKYKKVPLIIYNDDGSNYKKIFSQFKKMEVSKLFILCGGINQWQNDGYPVASKKVKINSNAKLALVSAMKSNK